MRCLTAARELAGRVPTVGPLHEEMPKKAALGEANESAARYAAKAPRGYFDGVPFAVKEQTAVRGFARQVGTMYIDASPLKEDATCVAELRRAGGLVLGTTPMTELGMSPVGQNKLRRMPKNPHDPRHVAGGSSTGSGVAVATGLTPFALGADGGGSIRIPSAINGVFGIKPTWGRVSRAGDYAEGTVAHVGPIASSTADLARVLEAISGPDPLDPETLFAAPKPAKGEWLAALGRGVRGLVIGVDEDEWADASPTVQRAGQDALRALEREGATLQRVRIGLARQAPLIGYMAIGLETRGALQVDWNRHARDMGYDLQMAMAALGEAKAADYVDAQRLRTGLRHEVAAVFQRVDLLALPTTVDTATAATEDEMASGFLDARVLAGLVRFNFLANLTGLPALTAPVGLDARLLPIGLQLVGDAWDEATVLAASAHLERVGAAKVERPAVSVRILP